MIPYKKPRRMFLRALFNGLAVVGGGFLLWFTRYFFFFKPHTVKTVIGPFSSFQKGSVTHREQDRLFLVRDSKGLYAISDTCTHRGCMLRMIQETFQCQCHQASFSLTGSPLEGPVDQPLDHYYIYEGKNRELVVDVTKIVHSTFRYFEKV